MSNRRRVRSLIPVRTHQWVLHWLRYVKGYSWNAIVAAGADTLGETYRKLSQSPDGWITFKAFVDTRWPPGSPSKVTTDNPFP